MATERPRRERRKPKRYVEEFSGLATVKTPVICNRDNKLYDVEVTEVDKVNKTVKLHFVGFG